MRRTMLFGLASILAVAVMAGTMSLPAQAGKANPNQPAFAFAKNAGFTTLAKAIQVADLVGTVNSTGPITIFAPTNEAFAKLPPGVLEDLLANPAELRKILLLHVVEGDVPSSTAVTLIGSCAPSINNLDLCFSSTTEGVGLQVNNAAVTATDIRCKNAVIHVVEDVILPN
jgi:uncharacterized surface protein with fasciclin (FAS1) repeats